MEQGVLYQAADAKSRNVHAANIMRSQQAAQHYRNFHHETFLQNKLKKYVVINAAGERLESAMEKEALLTNANGTVRHEDFLVIRDVIVEVRRNELTGMSDLDALSFNVGIGEQMVGFENINEFKAAQQEMNPNKYDNNDTVFTEDFVPNPITHSSFEIPWRQQGFDYKRSLAMPESIRQVLEKQEETLFNGNTDIKVTFNGTQFQIFGYTTHPDRGTGTISDWTVAANNDKIVTESVTQVGLMRKTQKGIKADSLIMYVSDDIWAQLGKDYVAGQPSKTIKMRLEEISEIKEVKPAEKLATTAAVLVHMDRKSVEKATASPIIVVPHLATNPMAPQAFTAYAAEIHQIKIDSNSKTGIRHLAP